MSGMNITSQQGQSQAKGKDWKNKEKRPQQQRQEGGQQQRQEGSQSQKRDVDQQRPGGQQQRQEGGQPQKKDFDQQRPSGGQQQRQAGGQPQKKDFGQQRPSGGQQGGQPQKQEFGQQELSGGQQGGQPQKRDFSQQRPSGGQQQQRQEGGQPQKRDFSQQRPSGSQKQSPNVSSQSLDQKKSPSPGGDPFDGGKMKIEKEKIRKSELLPVHQRQNAFGTRGDKIKLEVNYLEISVAKMIESAYHYDVSIEPETPKRLLRAAMAEFNRRFFPNIAFAYDGSKNLYTGIPLTRDVTEQVVVRDDDWQRDKQFKVTVRFAAQVDLNALRK
jgi:hypothetical protein